MKRIITLLFFILLTTPCFAEVSVIKNDVEPFYDKVEMVTSEVIKNPDSKNVERYIKIMSLRATYYAKARRDYENAADDLRGALYFLNQEKNDKYDETKKRLDLYLTKMNYFPSDSDALELAKNLYFEGKYFASAYEFDLLLKKNYEPATCYEFLGDISQKIMQPLKISIDYYKKSLAIYPQNVDVEMKLADVYSKKGDFELQNATYKQVLTNTKDSKILDKIIEIYTRKMSENPNDTDVLEILGLSYQQKGEFEKTRTLFETALEIAPEDIFLQYSYAILLHETGEYNEAIKIYDKILKDNPYESQIRISKAECLLKLGKKNEAIKQYQIVLAVYADSKQAQYGLYKALGGANLDEIVGKFYPLNTTFKPSSEYYLNLADYLLENDKISDAIVFYRGAISKNAKNAKAYINLYKAYELLGQNAFALLSIKNAYNIMPENKEIAELYAKINENSIEQKNELALEYLKQNDFSKAVLIYSQIEPKTVDIYVSMANCYKVLKNYNKAKEALQAALKIAPVNSDIYYNLALIYLEQNSPVSAKQCLVKAVALNKGNLKAHKLLFIIQKKEIHEILNNAFDFYEKKQYAKAKEIIDTGLKKYNKNAQLYYYRGLIYQAMKDDKSALSDFRHAIEHDKTFNLAYFSLAEILDNTGSQKEALEFYERFLSGQVFDEKLREKAQQRAIELGKKYY